MPLKRPTNKLGVYGKLDINPENAVGNFLESKQQEKSFIKPPEWDVSRSSLELFAIQNEREYMDMLKLQDTLLQNTKIQKAINSNRIAEMYKIQKELRGRFISVNEFIRACEEKKRFAEKKIEMEKATHIQLKQDVLELAEDIKNLQEFQTVLSKTVEELEPYETVIKEVVENSNLFNSVQDCMDRCDALMLAQVEISELERTKIISLEDMRRSMIKATNDASLTILGLNNDLAELERSYNSAKTESLKWEKILAATKEYISENELTRNRILDAIQHMYKILCKRNGVDPVVGRLAIEEQLDYIKDEIEILQEIVKICNIKTQEFELDEIEGK